MEKKNIGETSAYVGSTSNQLLIIYDLSGRVSSDFTYFRFESNSLFSEMEIWVKFQLDYSGHVFCSLSSGVLSCQICFVHLIIFGSGL